MSKSISLTSELFWQVAGVAALIDLVVIAFVVWRISPTRFRQFKWELVGASAFAWGTFSMFLLWGLWDQYYRHFFPEYMRWLAPTDAVLYATIALVLWWVAVRLPGNPVVSFCLLGGLESIPEHLWGIYGLGILNIVPILQGVGQISVIIFAVFEYIFYWGFVLVFAILIQDAIGWWRRGRARQSPRLKPTS